MSKQPLGALILHGFTASLDCVSDVEVPIRQLGLPTRLPVLRGHGAESPEALRGVKWEDWVADAASALADLRSEADKAIVFGHSMGGLVALTLAADHNNHIDSVVAAAAATQLASPLAPGRPLHFLVPLLGRVLNSWKTPPVYADRTLAQYDTNYDWAPIDALFTLLEFSQVTRTRLPEVRVPTLIMHSRKDSVVAPESADIIYNLISTPPDQKRIVWFDVTDHEMFRDCEREATVATVVNFVRERMRR